MTLRIGALAALLCRQLRRFTGPTYARPTTESTAAWARVGNGSAATRSYSACSAAVCAAFFSLLPNSPSRSSPVPVTPSPTYTCTSASTPDCYQGQRTAEQQQDSTDELARTHQEAHSNERNPKGQPVPRVLRVLIGN